MEIAILVAILLGALGLIAMIPLIHFSGSTNSNSADEEDQSDYPEVSFDVSHESVHSDISITDIVEVNTHTDEEPIIVATLTLTAESVTDGTIAICNNLPDIVQTFEDFHVRYFEFHCKTDASESAYCEKMGISQFHAEEFVTEEYSAEHLCNELRALDTGDDGAAPFDWMKCTKHQVSRNTATSGGEVAATTAATSSASCTTTSTTC